MRETSGMCDGTFTTAPQTGKPMDTGGDAFTFVAEVNVTAISGAGATATFVVEDSNDGVNWSSAALATNNTITAIGVYMLRVQQFGRYIRVRLSALAGTTPSITCAVSGIARD